VTVRAAAPEVSDPVDAVILSALPEEMRPLRAMLADVRRLAGDQEIWRGRWEDRQVALAVTGDGARNARAGAAAAFLRVRARAAIAIGVAGAVSPGLAAGDLLVAHQVMRDDGRACQEPAPALLAAAARLLAARPAALISVPRLAATRADKRRLQTVAADLAPGLVAGVDLESAAFAAAAAAWGVPWLIVRAVSDEAGEELPALLNDCLDDGGALRRGRLAVRLFRQPSVLPQLLSLRQRVQTCAEALAAAVLTILPTLPALPASPRSAELDGAEGQAAAET
jgi:adenosylhomocysteine nucleosidase